METSCSEDKETLLELVWIARRSDESRWPTLITTPSTLLMVRMALISLVDNINGPSASSEYIDGLSVWMGVGIRFGRSHNLQASSKCYRNCGEGCGYAPYVILVFFGQELNCFVLKYTRDDLFETGWKREWEMRFIFSFSNCLRWFVCSSIWAVQSIMGRKSCRKPWKAFSY